MRKAKQRDARDYRLSSLKRDLDVIVELLAGNPLSVVYNQKYIDKLTKYLELKGRT